VLSLEHCHDMPGLLVSAFLTMETRKRGRMLIKRLW